MQQKNHKQFTTSDVIFRCMPNCQQAETEIEKYRLYRYSLIVVRRSVW